MKRGRREGAVGKGSSESSRRALLFVSVLQGMRGERQSEKEPKKNKGKKERRK
jgi:hypothetical protein